MNNKTEDCSPKECFSHSISNWKRREFLFGSGAAILSVTLPEIGESSLLRKEYPKNRIGKISELKPNETVSFRYPWDHENAENILLLLSEPAGGGIGPQKNIVAFNTLCTHQGISLTGEFDEKSGIAGPCSMHWTTFDLSRHGIVISGHATAPLPQIILEESGDDIYAVGVQSLIFGFHDNREQPDSDK